MSDPSDDALLVELFVHPHDIYDQADTLRLTRATPSRLQTLVDESALEPLDVGGTVLFEWEDVVKLALERWTPRMIAAAIRRAGLEHALPLLNETRTILVELPLYQIRLLHWLAVTRTEPGKPELTVSDVLEHDIHMMLALDAAEHGAASAIPNLGAAMEFPFVREPPRRGEKTCIYCGGAVPAKCDACTSCRARHDAPQPPTRRV